jgi:hypothetical protein
MDKDPRLITRAMRSTNSGKDGVLQRVEVSEFLAEENIIELFTRTILEARTAHRCRWAGQDLWRVINRSEPKMATDAKLEKVSLWEWRLLLIERAMIVT